jgi:hypothetical protein
MTTTGKLQWIKGTDCGYRDESLMCADMPGGGSVSVRKVGTAWIRSFFSPNANTPFSTKAFANRTAAMASAE